MLDSEFFRIILILISTLALVFLFFSLPRQNGRRSLFAAYLIDWQFYFLTGMMCLCLAFISVLGEMYLLGLLHVSIAILELFLMHKQLNQQTHETLSSPFVRNMTNKANIKLNNGVQ